MKSAPIRFFDRATGRIEEEQVYGEGFLRWAYGNPLGRLTVSVAVKRAWFSRWYGWRMDQAKSQEKIAPFLLEYGLNADEFEASVDSFESFNEFFYRKLKPAARPIAVGDDVVVFPADGRHLAIDDIDAAEVFYIKGQRFDRRSFIGDDALAEEFENGSLLISRLCPVDYHRYHFPVAGRATDPVLLNGHLRSVSPLALRRELGILWENKRCRTLIESPSFGKVLIFEIGATCVGSIHSTFTQGEVSKGQEKGYFSFGGSCVATFFQKGAIRFDQDLSENAAKAREVYALMGERCGIAQPGKSERGRFRI